MGAVGVRLILCARCLLKAENCHEYANAYGAYLCRNHGGWIAVRHRYDELSNARYRIN